MERAITDRLEAAELHEKFIEKLTSNVLFSMKVIRGKNAPDMSVELRDLILNAECTIVSRRGLRVKITLINFYEDEETSNSDMQL